MSQRRAERSPATMGRINPKREVSRSPRAISLQRIPQVDPAFVSRRALSGREVGLSKREVSAQAWHHVFGLRSSALASRPGWL